jgi:signal transduction histidine kinase
VTFDPQIPETLAVPLDRTDLAEVLGNLLDNASRYAAARVRISARTSTAGPVIVIEDDGEGIAPADRKRMMERGIRLDERPDGAGLGLAIVQDVLDTYGWRLTLAASDDLGGLKVTMTPAESAEM